MRIIKSVQNQNTKKILLNSEIIFINLFIINIKNSNFICEKSVKKSKFCACQSEKLLQTLEKNDNFMDCFCT